MARLTLANALKLKKRLSSKLDDLFQQLISTENVLHYPPQCKVEFKDDIQKLEEQVSSLSMSYSQLCGIVARATSERGIPEMLTLIDKMKLHLRWLKNLQTEPQQMMFTEEEVPYSTDIQITKEDKLNKIRLIQANIYRNQDKIDTINASTVVDVPDEIVKLVETY